MNIKATSTIGKAGQGATWTTSMEANEVQTLALAQFGIIYLQQRNKDVDSILGITEKGVNKDGKEITVRTGRKRGAVTITPAMREKLAESMATLVLPDEGGKWEVSTQVTEYAGEVSGPAYKRSVATIMGLHTSGIPGFETTEAVDIAVDAILLQAGVSRIEVNIPKLTKVEEAKPAKSKKG